ncbi:myosin heavy chain, clone 203-like isoform X2 [Branchiostoma lanceolatum]|uniref:myosin heavy chain, clone 203-like isoform X2 n=1 Tax=Branchiostoma lanceolatum TaxID=7740 RepID=UPI0034524FB0
MPETMEKDTQESAKQRNVKSVQFNLADNTTILLEGGEHERTGGHAAMNGAPNGDHLNHKKPAESNSIMSAEIGRLNEELKTLRDKLEEEVEELRQEVNYKRKTYLAQSKELDSLVEEERKKREESLQEINSGFESKLKDRRQRCDELDKELTAREGDIEERTRTLEERNAALLKREEEIERRVEQCEANDSQVSDWEKELVARKKACQEFQQELDDMERYLNKRQDMCNSKDDDLKMLDEELSRLRTELQKNIDSMEEDAVQENAEVIGRLRRLSTTSPSVVVGTTAEKTKVGNTVLQAVVRKLQHDLQETENIVEKKDQEISELGRKVLSLETELQKKDQKTKQLESQLTISLGEIRMKESSERKEPSHRKHHHDDRSAANASVDHRARSGTWGPDSRSRSSSRRHQEEPLHRSDKSSTSSGSGHSIMKEYDMNSSKACSIM